MFGLVESPGGCRTTFHMPLKNIDKLYLCSTFQNRVTRFKKKSEDHTAKDEIKHYEMIQIDVQDKEHLHRILNITLFFWNKVLIEAE